jgi:cytochrome b561
MCRIGNFVMKPKRTTYDTWSMLLHWGTAALVFAVGLCSPFLDHVARPGLSTFHNVGGTVVLLLALVWLVWQMQRPAVPQPTEIGVTERGTMKWTVMLINVLLVLGPLSGLVLLFAHGGALGIGSLQVSYHLPVDQLAMQRLTLLHHVLGALLVMLGGGHALHAVWHHVIRRDRLLARMLPWHEQ